MPWPIGARETRRLRDSDSKRNPFIRDYDRVLFSSAFERLAGISQLARAGESSLVHNRQQHTLKVARIGWRLADRLLKQYDAQNIDLSPYIQPELVAAASLVHDLGHPPFGHVGERVLNRLLDPPPGDSGAWGTERDGFEGNAQSFRIITKLAVITDDHPGLNLCRATLAATLKYPWQRSDPGGAPGTAQHARYRKWSCYDSEAEDFAFAMEFQPDGVRTIETDLMDWADDAAYSIDDIIDFHCCSLLPWRDIFEDSGKEKLFDDMIKDKRVEGKAIEEARSGFEECYEKLKDMFLHGFKIMLSPYEGSHPQRVAVRRFKSTLDPWLRDAVSIDFTGSGPRVRIDPFYRNTVDLLKQIVVSYVRNSPPVQAQRIGYARIVEGLFTIFRDEAKGGMPQFTPKRLQYLWDESTVSEGRFAADCVASLSEHEATRLFARLTGNESGSMLDPIVR